MQGIKTGIVRLAYHLCHSTVSFLSAAIHHLETLVPANAYSQSRICDGMKEWLSEKRTRRLLDKLYQRSSIETRYSVVADIFEEDEEGRHFGHFSTAERNDIYCEASKRLAIELGRKLFAGCADFSPKEVTHVIFASCTGFCNPGPEYHLMRAFGIPKTAERYTLGFMGCYAAFPALRMASQFCAADPDAVVLVMCLELSSLHMQVGDSQDSLLGNSLFSDGAAAAIVSARELAIDQAGFKLHDFTSSIVEAGEEDMAWTIGDRGFDLVLSSYVPKILGATIRDLVPDAHSIDKWAIHPGGRAILDNVIEALELPEDAVDASREVLRDYGNMSSATVLFVLKALLENTDEPGDFRTKAIAFGPGLTVELADLIMRIPAGKDIGELLRARRTRKAAA